MRQIIYVLILMFILCSCAPNLSGTDIRYVNPGVSVKRIYDDKYKVVCWIAGHGGISCIPENQLEIKNADE